MSQPIFIHPLGKMVNGAKKIFRDKISSAKIKRPGLQEALDFLHEGQKWLIAKH